MGLLNFLSKTYAGKWSVVSRTNMSKDELDMVKKVLIVNSDYGLSACFFTNRGQQYIPVSNESTLSEGDRVDLDSIEILTLSKEGESDIYRLDGKAI